LKIEPAACDERLQPHRCTGRKVALAFAASVYTGFWCIEADKADRLPAHADRVAVNDLHSTGRDRIRSCWRRQRGEGKSYGSDGARVRYRG
jgi:hypothetical protein